MAAFVHWVVLACCTGRGMRLGWKDLKPHHFKESWNGPLLESLCRMWKSGEGIKECMFCNPLPFLPLIHKSYIHSVKWNGIVLALLLTLLSLWDIFWYGFGAVQLKFSQRGPGHGSELSTNLTFAIVSLGKQMWVVCDSWSWGQRKFFDPSIFSQLVYIKMLIMSSPFSFHFFCWQVCTVPHHDTMFLILVTWFPSPFPTKQLSYYSHDIFLLCS